MARRDWRKQLLRIRQIADQNLGRVEKTEALTSDLQTLEKRVEQYGKVFAGTSKKLISCLQTQPGQDREKRQKKLPDHALSYQLLDSSAQLGIDTLVGQIFQICGDAEAHVATKTLDLEIEIENQVLAPIYKLVEQDIPAILKHKKNLQKVVLDMDSAKTRYAAAIKEQSKASGSNQQSSTAKVDNLREEFDDACYKVDQCRDQLATEMFTLASREAELSNILLELIKCQAKYHRDVLDALEKRIPQMEEQMQFYQHVPVYGKPIEDHLERTNRTIALVLEECIKNLITLGGLEEEGLFRIAGAANKIKKLKAAFDSEQCAEIAGEYDVHVIAGALKLYLRELPDPLMKSSLFPDWMKAAHMPTEERLQALADVLAKLPKLNHENLKFLIKFLHKIAEFQEVNKMSPSNLSIVIGPNLIWEQGANGPSVLTTSAQSAIVEALISHCDYFFPSDVDFRQYMKDPIRDNQPPVNLRRDKKREKCGTGNEKVTKRHAISLTEPPLGLSLSASGMSNDGISVADDSTDKVMIRLDADGVVSDGNRPRGSQRSGSDASMHNYDEDIFEQIFTNLETSSLEPTPPDLLSSVTSGDNNNSSHVAPVGPADYRQPSPDIMLQGNATQALFSSIHGSATVPFGSQENMSTSSGSLNVLDSQSGARAPSPKPPRRMNKKPAPLPPGERPHCPAPPPPGTTTTVTTAGGTAAATETVPVADVSSLPYPIKPPLPYYRPPEQTQQQPPPPLPPQPQQLQVTTTGQESSLDQIAMTKSSEQQQIPIRPEKPPEQQQQQQLIMKHQERSPDQQAVTQTDRPTEHQPAVSRPERPPDYQLTSRPERPPGPPPEKPEKPARPEKPDKPSGGSVEKLYPSLSPIVTSPPVQPKKLSLTSSEEQSPPQMTKIVLNAPPEVMEKPPLPPPPGIKPDGSGHSHRPNAEVLPGHRRQSSGSSRPPRPQPPPPPPPPNKPTFISQGDDLEKAAVSGANSDDQMPVSPKPGEDTYL